MSRPPRSAAMSVGFLLAAVVVLTVNLRAPLVALGPVVGFIREDLGVSASFMGIVAALPMLAFAAFSPLAAALARRFGMENVLVGSIVLMIAGLAVRSAYPAAVPLVAGTVVLSASIAMSNVLLPALAKRSLPDRVGLVVGTLSATMAVSSMLAAAVAVPLAQWQNWRWPLGIWLLFAVAALPVWIYAGRRTENARPPLPAAVSDGLNVWKSRPAWCISVFMGTQSLLFYAMVNFLPSVLVEKGMTPLAAGNYGSLFQAAALAGVLTVSAVIGKSRNKQAVNLATAMLLTAGIAGIWLGPAATAWIWVSLAGAGSSGVFAAILILFALRTDTPQQAASLSGMAQAVGYAIAAFGPLGMGVLHDRLGSWSAAVGLLTALAAAECVLAWVAANPKTLSQMAKRPSEN